jgi:hypothetical protein
MRAELDKNPHGFFAPGTDRCKQERAFRQAIPRVGIGTCLQQHPHDVRARGLERAFQRAHVPPVNEVGVGAVVQRRLNGVAVAAVDRVGESVVTR